MTDAPILCEVADGVASVTLNRPDKLNAFNEAMHQALARALDRIEADGTVRALLLTGAGRAFCAGPGPRRSGDGRRRRAARSRRHARAPLQPADPAPRAARAYRWSARSTALRRAPAPTSRSPATSCWPRARRSSSRPSARSASCPIPAAPTSCRASSATRARDGPRAARRGARRRGGGALGADLARGRRRRAAGRGHRARPPSRRASRPKGSA